MRIRTLLAMGLAVLFVVPAFGNGPGMMNDPGMSGNSNTTTTNPRGGGGGRSPRKRWVRKRIRELQPQIDQRRGANNLVTEMDRFQAAIDNRPVRVLLPQGLNQREMHEYMKARFEQLALKAELGRTSPREIAELRALMPFVVNRWR